MMHTGAAAWPATHATIATHRYASMQLKNHDYHTTYVHMHANTTSYYTDEHEHIIIIII